MKIFEIINKNILYALDFNRFRKHEKTEKGPVITISREQGAGGRIIASRLANKLRGKWDYYDRDIVEKIAKESKVKLEKINERDEKTIPYFEEVFESLMEKDYFSLDDYQKTLFKILFDLGAQGHAIIVGRGANFIFKNALKVRIVADDEQKIAWLMEYEKMTKKEAIKVVKKTDKESREFISNLFNKNIEDPKHYDLVIKTSLELPVEEAVDIITRIAKRKFKL